MRQTPATRLHRGDRAGSSATTGKEAGAHIGTECEPQTLAPAALRTDTALCRIPMTSLLARRAVATVARRSAATSNAAAAVVAARPAGRTTAAVSAVAAVSGARCVSTSSPALFTARPSLSASSPTPTSRPTNTAPLYGWWGFTPEQDALREMVAKFAAKEIAPRAADIDRNNEFPADLWRKFGELGLLGITVSEEDGGTTNTHATYERDHANGDNGCAGWGTLSRYFRLRRLC